MKRLGLSTGGVGSVLDPTQTGPTGISWKAKAPKTDCRQQSVKSVSSSDGGRSVVKVTEI